MKEMQMMQGMDNDMFGDMHNVVINTNHPLIGSKVLGADDAQSKEVAAYLHKLALIQQNMLKGEALSEFVKQSLERI
jgi:molecular chaperone HtpG